MGNSIDGKGPPTFPQSSPNLRQGGTPATPPFRPKNSSSRGGFWSGVKAELKAGFQMFKSEIRQLSGGPPHSQSNEKNIHLTLPDNTRVFLQGSENQQVEHYQFENNAKTLVIRTTDKKIYHVAVPQMHTKNAHVNPHFASAPATSFYSKPGHLPAHAATQPGHGKGAVRPAIYQGSHLPSAAPGESYPPKPASVDSTKAPIYVAHSLPPAFANQLTTFSAQRPNKNENNEILDSNNHSDPDSAYNKEIEVLDIFNLIKDFSSQPIEKMESLFSKINEKANGDPEFLNMLKEAKDKEGRTAMHFAAKSGDVGLLGYLHMNGMDLNAKTGKHKYLGTTPLHDAITSGHFDAVKYLLDNGANIESKNRVNLNASKLAATFKMDKLEETSDLFDTVSEENKKKTERNENKIKIICLLVGQNTEKPIEIPTDPKELKRLAEIRNAFIEASDKIRGGTGDLRKILAEGPLKAPIFFKDESPEKALRELKASDEQLVLKRFNEGVEPKEFKFGGDNEFNLLHRAAEFGWKDVTKFLLENNPELKEEKKGNGKTPLDVAFEKGQIDIVKIFLEGTGVNVKDKGNTMLIDQVKKLQATKESALEKEEEEISNRKKELGASPPSKEAYLTLIIGGHEKTSANLKREIETSKEVIQKLEAPLQ